MGHGTRFQNEGKGKRWLTLLGSSSTPFRSSKRRLTREREKGTSLISPVYEGNERREHARKRLEQAALGLRKCYSVMSLFPSPSTAFEQYDEWYLGRRDLSEELQPAVQRNRLISGGAHWPNCLKYLAGPIVGQ